MEFEEGTFYRVTKAGYGVPPKMIVRMVGFSFRNGRSGRGWYARFLHEDDTYYVRVSTKNKLGPNAFDRVSSLEVLGDTAE
jgi:hypothetical protein